MGLVYLTLSLVCLSGCWDMREINDLGFVTAVAIDQAPAPNKYRITVQIANPSGAGEKAQSSQGGVWVGTQEGKSLFDAIRNLIRISSRRVMWAHNGIVIIGEAQARKSIQPVIDFFTHNPELRMKTIVVVAHGEAKPYILAKTGMETPSGLAYASFADYSSLLGQSIHSDLIDIMEDLSNAYLHPWVAAVNLTKQPVAAEDQKAGEAKEAETVEISGSAVFRKAKLQGWLSPVETRGLAWMGHETNNTVVTVNDPRHQHQSVAVELSDLKTNLTIKFVSGKPQVMIKLAGQGNIAEEDGPSAFSSLRVVKRQVERLVERQIALEIHTGLEKVQKKYRVDTVHFATYMRIQHLRLWEGGFEHKWPKVFPDIPVQVQVKIRIISSVLKQEPSKMR